MVLQQSHPKLVYLRAGPNQSLQSPDEPLRAPMNATEHYLAF